MVNGKEQSLTQLRRLVGFVPQEDIMLRELTVYENIELPLLYLKMSGSERKKKVEVVMER